MRLLCKLVSTAEGSIPTQSVTCPLRPYHPTYHLREYFELGKCYVGVYDLCFLYRLRYAWKMSSLSSTDAITHFQAFLNLVKVLRVHLFGRFYLGTGLSSGMSMLVSTIGGKPMPYPVVGTSFATLSTANAVCAASFHSEGRC
jgi:hypothetical protein